MSSSPPQLSEDAIALRSNGTRTAAAAVSDHQTSCAHWSESKRQQKGRRARALLQNCPELMRPQPCIGCASGGACCRGGGSTDCPTPSRALIVGGAGAQLATDITALAAALAPFDPLDTVAPSGRAQSFVWFATAAAAQATVEGLAGTCPPGLSLPLSFAYAREDAAPRSVAILSTAAEAEAAIPGLCLLPNYVSLAEEAALLACCADSHYLSKFEGDLVTAARGGEIECGQVERQDVDEASADGGWIRQRHRAVQHFGFNFDYATNDAITPTACGTQLPAPILHLARRMFEADKILPCMPDQVTANRYYPGDGIAPHVDNPQAFADGIASISLCADTTMVFERPSGAAANSQPCAVLLPRRSALVMCGEARYNWQHGIPNRKGDVIDGLIVPRRTRVSLTFRTRILH